jgi:hypothetical protein
LCVGGTTQIGILNLSLLFLLLRFPPHFPPSPPPFSGPGSVIHLAGVSANHSASDSTMGIQSQLRQCAIKKCKKMETKIKANRVCKQNAIGGGVAFVEALHCSVCKARRLNARGNVVKIPHRPHHKRCSMNRKTRGLSAMTVFVNREATRNVAINTALMASVLGQRLATEAAEAGANVARFFAPHPQLNPPSANVVQLPLGANEAVAWRNQQGGDPQKFQQKTRSSRRDSRLHDEPRPRIQVARAK